MTQPEPTQPAEWSVIACDPATGYTSVRFTLGLDLRDTTSLAVDLLEFCEGLESFTHKIVALRIHYARRYRRGQGQGRRCNLTIEAHPHRQAERTVLGDEMIRAMACVLGALA